MDLSIEIQEFSGEDVVRKDVLSFGGWKLENFRKYRLVGDFVIRNPHSSQVF